MSDLHDAVALEELVEGVPHPVRVDGRDLMLVRWRDEVFAVRDACPHQIQSFIAGRVHDRILSGSAIGEFEVTRDEPVLQCPWHAWEFSLRDGRCLGDPRHRVRIYETAVRDGRVLIDVGRQTAVAR
jgi:nitrite reductase/ring-hydroxylating ferredoxin subunit